MKRLPENGLVVFANEDLCEFIEPPMPVKSSYVCGKQFETQEIRQFFLPTKEHHFLTFTPKEALLWSTQGTKRILHQSIEIDLQTDSARGGQSAPRFGRIRQGHRQALLKSIAEHCTRTFANPPIVSGSGILGDEYCRTAGTEMIRIAATDRAGAMKETLVKAATTLADQDIATKALNQAVFEELLATGRPLLFGEEINLALENSNLRQLFSDGSVEFDFRVVLPVLDLSGFGGVVGVPYYLDPNHEFRVDHGRLNPRAAEFVPRGGQN